MKGVCLRTGWTVDSDRPACRIAKAFLRVVESDRLYTPPSKAPILDPADRAHPVCGDCNLFQERLEEKRSELDETCHGCGGKGWVYDRLGKPAVCPVCGGSGKCHGRSVAKDIRYPFPRLGVSW